MEATLDITKVRRWKRYDDFQQVDHRWIKKLPKHWQKKRLSYLFNLLGSGTTPNTSERRFYEDGTIPWVNTGDLTDGIVHEAEKCVNETAVREHSALKLYPEGTLLIALYGATIGKLGLLKQQSTVNQACFAMGDAKPEIDTSFVLYWLLGSRDHIVSMAYGGGQPNISGELIRSLRMPVPPLPEQRAIAAFLDRETARIDALIGHKQRLIALLEEKRQAVISHAVEGRDEWLCVRLKFVTDILSGFAFKSEGFSNSGDDIRLLRGANVAPGYTDWTDEVRWPLEDARTFEAYQLAEGDLVFAMDRPWISAGIRVARISASDLPCLLLQRVARLRSFRGLSQEFLELLLSCKQFEAYFDPILTGVSVPHISPTQLLDFSFRLPSLDVQISLCQKVRAYHEKAERVKARIQYGIERLQEYRTALISAAVTGQIDVRDEVKLDG